MRFIVLICFSLFSGLTCAGDELWQEFKKYRASIGSAPTLSSQYFAKSVNEEWLGSIFSPRKSRDDVLAALGAIKSRALFGRRISSIYYVKEERKRDNSAELTLVYKTPKNSGPYTYLITYANESGVWLMSKTLSDNTKPTVQLPASPIYEFK